MKKEIEKIVDKYIGNMGCAIKLDDRRRIGLYTTVTDISCLKEALYNYMTNKNNQSEGWEERLRYKMLEWSSEYNADCKFREIEDEKRNDLTMQSVNDLFEKFNSRVTKFLKKELQVKDKYYEDVIMDILDEQDRATNLALDDNKENKVFAVEVEVIKDKFNICLMNGCKNKRAKDTNICQFHCDNLPF